MYSSYSQSQIQGEQSIGGLVGKLAKKSCLERSYSQGIVNGRLLLTLDIDITQFINDKIYLFDKPANIIENSYCFHTTDATINDKNTYQGWWFLNQVISDGMWVMGPTRPHLRFELVQSVKQLLMLSRQMLSSTTTGK